MPLSFVIVFGVSVLLKLEESLDEMLLIEEVEFDELVLLIGRLEVVLELFISGTTLLLLLDVISLVSGVVVFGEPSGEFVLFK